MDTVVQYCAETPGDDDSQPALYVLSEPATDSGADGAPPGITPEIIAVLYTAATAFVGSPIRIVAVRLLSTSREDDPSSWAERGRDIIHASHNMVQHGH